MTTAEQLVALLRERGLTIGIAESLTGGDVTSALVAVPGASEVLLGGVVAYATAVKHTLLGVDVTLLAEHGAVHPEAAKQMADGVRRTVAVQGRAADVGIATTGVAGPDAADGQAVGTVFVGIAVPDGIWVRSFSFSGDRVTIRAQATEAALVAALEALRGMDPDAQDPDAGSTSPRDPDPGE